MLRNEGSNVVGIFLAVIVFITFTTSFSICEPALAETLYIFGKEHTVEEIKQVIAWLQREIDEGRTTKTWAGYFGEASVETRKKNGWTAFFYGTASDQEPLDQGLLIQGLQRILAGTSVWTGCGGNSEFINTVFNYAFKDLGAQAFLL